MTLFKKKKVKFSDMALEEKWLNWNKHNDKTIDEYDEKYVAKALGITAEEVNRIKQEGF